MCKFDVKQAKKAEFVNAKKDLEEAMQAKHSCVDEDKFREAIALCS